MFSEYSMLRQEIILSSDTIKKYNSLLYTATVALLAFAFNQSSAILFLLPFIVLFPVCILVKKETIQMMRIGAYILVFLEAKGDILWETRLNMYDSLITHNQHKTTPMSVYLGLSLVCVMLSASYTDYSVWNPYSAICLILQVGLLCASVLLFVFKAPNYVEIKRNYISQWKRVKKYEDYIYNTVV